MCSAFIIFCNAQHPANEYLSSHSWLIMYVVGMVIHIYFFIYLHMWVYMSFCQRYGTYWTFQRYPNEYQVNWIFLKMRYWIDIETDADLLRLANLSVCFEPATFGAFQHYLFATCLQLAYIFTCFSMCWGIHTWSSWLVWYGKNKKQL